MTTGLEPGPVVKLVFLLLGGVGIVQIIFLGHHIQYVLLARTTLEHKIILDRQYQAMVERSEIYEVPANPFDKGYAQNLSISLGPIQYLLLPIYNPTKRALDPSNHKKKVH